MNRTLITTVSVSGVVFAVWLALSPTSGVNRIADCPVRVSQACVDLAADAGLTVRHYERIRFPASVTALADGGRDVEMPLAMQRAARCVEVLDWSDCTLSACTVQPAICGLWDAGIPFRLAPAASATTKRKNSARGFGACTRVDGSDPGEMNVYRAAQLLGTCEPMGLSPGFGVYDGERAEDDP